MYAICKFPVIGFKDMLVVFGVPDGPDGPIKYIDPEDTYTCCMGNSGDPIDVVKFSGIIEYANE